MMQRRRTCNLSEARARHLSSVAFLEAAEQLSSQGCNRDVVVTNAVHAGIAASDVMCCVHLGERSADQDHAAAIRLLASVNSGLGNDLGRLFALKTTAAYEGRTVRAADVTASLRRARKLVDAATDILRKS